MSNNLAMRKEVVDVQSLLEKMKPQMSMALPKHITPERMIRIALTAVQNTPKLLECDRNSLLLAILRSAQLGLEPDGILGQAYLVPYAGKVQLIPGYRGLIDLARRSGEVSNIIAKEVYENDVFEIDFSQEIPFVHKPILKGERGEVVFFWALARFKDGGFHWDYMAVDEVIKIRNGSSGWQNAVKYNKTKDSPWENHFIEMAKKTVIRRIAKYLPMSVQKASLVEDLIDSNQKFSVDAFGEVIVGEIVEGEPNAESKSKKNASESLKDKISSKEPQPDKVDLAAQRKAAEIALLYESARSLGQLSELREANLNHLNAMPDDLLDNMKAEYDKNKTRLGG